MKMGWRHACMSPPPTNICFSIFVSNLSLDDMLRHMLHLPHDGLCQHDSNRFVITSH